MIKILFGYVVVIAIYTAGLEASAAPPSEEPIVVECTSLADQLAKWELKLYQDSCMFRMAYTDKDRQKTAPRTMQAAQEQLLFDLAKEMRYDRIKILELKKQ